MRQQSACHVANHFAISPHSHSRRGCGPHAPAPHRAKKPPTSQATATLSSGISSIPWDATSNATDGSDAHDAAAAAYGIPENAHGMALLRAIFYLSHPEPCLPFHFSWHNSVEHNSVAFKILIKGSQPQNKILEPPFTQCRCTF